MSLREEIRDELMSFEDDSRHRTGDRYQELVDDTTAAIFALFREAMLSPDAIEAAKLAEIEMQGHALTVIMQASITAALDVVLGDSQ